MYPISSTKSVTHISLGLSKVLLHLWITKKCYFLIRLLCLSFLAERLIWLQIDQVSALKESIAESCILNFKNAASSDFLRGRLARSNQGKVHPPLYCLERLLGFIKKGFPNYHTPVFKSINSVRNFRWPRDYFVIPPVDNNWLSVNLLLKNNAAFINSARAPQNEALNFMRSKKSYIVSCTDNARNWLLEV